MYYTEQRGGLPILLHIPHASIHIPADYRPDFVLPQQELDHEARWMADPYTDELFPLSNPSYYAIRSDVSRIALDVERFANDVDEPMNKYGMGAVYEKTSTGAPLKNISPKRKQFCMENIYHPYHEALNTMTTDCLKTFGHCFLIDCHSFPSVPRYYEDQTPDRPDICLGTDPGYTPRWAIQTLTDFFTSHGLSVKQNTPFSGCMVPHTFFLAASRPPHFFSIMIEVNRRLYMDEISQRKKSSFDDTQKIIAEAVHILSAIAL